MNQELSQFAARLREMISHTGLISDQQFNSLALELFALQSKHNFAYCKICEARKLTPETVGYWTQIPSVPTAAFKELELTSIPPEKRTAVFHSSGTTEQKPSRHFHCAESLAVYEASLWEGFRLHFDKTGDLIFLTPRPAVAPRSSLVYMFETIRQMTGQPETIFTGDISTDLSWTVDFPATIQRLKTAADTGNPLKLLGTAFSFVHLLDYLIENQMQFQLPEGSRVMETGGYKNRSRTLPKAELHALITERLGVPRENIFCEYGMSELSSQAYAPGALASSRQVPGCFRFPPWARAQIISPETGREVADGETGIIRVFDLANVFSVAAIQTEDLGVRRGDGFELIGRAPLADARGCSLMSAQIP